MIINVEIEGKKYSVTMLFPKKTLADALTAQKHPAATWMPKDNCAGFYQEIVNPKLVEWIKG